MRFITFIKNQFAPVCMKNNRDASALVNQFNGAWEVWLQAQVAVSILNDPHSQNWEFEREKSFPNSAQTCDFVVRPGNAPEVTIWIELKVLLKSGAVGLLTRFIKDVDKLIEMRPNFVDQDNNTGGAVAFAPDSARSILENANTYLDPDFEKYRYATWDPSDGEPVLEWRQFSSGVYDGVTDADAVILYRAVLSET